MARSSSRASASLWAGGAPTVVLFMDEKAVDLKSKRRGYAAAIV